MAFADEPVLFGQFRENDRVDVTTDERVPTLGGGGGGTPQPDPEALLVALVLVPASYPRNRFFELYRTPVGKRVRRRAAALRTMLEELRGGAEGVHASVWGEGVELRYALPELAAVRRVRLERVEVTLLAAVLRRTGARHDVIDPLAALVGEPAIGQLGPVLARLLQA
jgi:hypothetical protein